MTTINNAITAEPGELSTHTDKNSAPRKTLGLYLHIPFCIRKCNYCDFLSFGGISQEIQEAYFHAIMREIQSYGEIYGNKYYVDSIFIGGGTPSLIDERLISGLMDAVRESFSIDPNAEISIESNPKTLTKAKMKAYLDSGINRLSIGAQSFDDRLLAVMGRVHSMGDFLKNYFLARECGFRNINFDLMFAIPGQTMEVWMDTFRKAVELAPEHISFYSLQLEEGTPFFTMFQEGTLKEIDDELDRKMYHEAVHMLKDRGYEHYEISNAAKKGFQCRHNLKYWSMDDFLGMGLGAHSFVGGRRFSNETGLDCYIRTAPSVAWHHENSREDSISEFLFTGMRKVEGVDLREFERRFGQPFEDVYSTNWSRIQRYLEEGLLIRSGDNLRFSVKGIDISNVILTEFI